MLRKRYDGLLATAVQQKQRLEEARRRRAEFDGCLETVLPRLQELEERSAAVVGSGEKVSDRLETLRVSGVEGYGGRKNISIISVTFSFYDIVL